MQKKCHTNLKIVWYMDTNSPMIITMTMHLTFHNGTTMTIRLFNLSQRLRIKMINIFPITPYPPLLIGLYDYCAMPDEEYDLMSNEVRNRILKGSPHAWIWRQIGINKIDERYRRLSSYLMHLHCPPSHSTPHKKSSFSNNTKPNQPIPEPCPSQMS